MSEAAEINSAPSFDDFFSETVNKLAFEQEVNYFIVIADAAKGNLHQQPSILYFWHKNGLSADPHDVVADLIDKKAEHLKATVKGLGNENFTLRIFTNDLNVINRRVKDQIISECHLVLSDRLQRKILSLRDYVVAMSLQTNDISSFLHKAVTQGLQNFFDYEAASAYYIDYNSDSIVLGATTGIPDLKNENLRRADIRFYPNSSSTVRQCFESGKAIFENRSITSPIPVGKFEEDISSPFNRLFLPIDIREGLRSRLDAAYGAEAKANGRVGVIRIVNTKRNGILNPVSDIDMHLLENFGEYLAVLCARYSRALSIIHDQEKLTHGYVTDLSTMKLRMQLFDIEFKSSLEAISRENTSESISGLLLDLDRYVTLLQRDFHAIQDGMAFQLHTVAEFSGGVIGNFGTDHANCDKPFRDVVLRVLEARNFLSQNYGRKKVRVTYSGQLEYQNSFKNMPSINVPQKTLFLALRNLFENSIKYTPRSQIPEIDLSWFISNNFLNFEVSDKGIGIRDTDATSLFKEGFRARNALREATRGNGLGLCVSKRGLQAYGGTLSYLGIGLNGKGAKFAIQVPIKNERARR